jgi:TPR repeat protein
MRDISENGLFLLLFLSLLLAGTPRAMAQGRDFRQAPKALTALKQGQNAQHSGNLQKAIALYCVAASTGNPEGYFRIGRLLATGPNRRAAMSLIDLTRQQSDKSVRHEVYHAGNITSG